MHLVLILLFLLGAEFSSSLTTPSVIIVGAGPAGIAAATRLLEHGHRNIVILEAENRIGGRVNSVFFGQAYVDLGAEWCHGHNIVYQLVKNLHILGHTESPRTVYHSSRKNFEKKFGEELISIMETIYVPDGQRDEDEGKTVGDYCIDKFNKTIHERYQTEPEKLEYAKSSVEFFHHYVLSSEGAFSWFEPSAKNDYRDCNGDLNLNWNGLGYKTALEVLMKKFPDPSKRLPFDETVLLNKEVAKVIYNASAIRNGVAVECFDNTTYEADHVILTPSIGVLKAHYREMFEPPLHKSKEDAIKQIGFGAVMKVVMHFETRWWPSSNFTGFNFIWSKEDRRLVLKEFPEGPVKDGRSWLTEIFCALPVEHNAKVLVGWLTGDLIPEIELLSNETMISGLTFVLNKFLSHQYNITEPDAILRTYWHSNPHFRGSYSFQTMEARKNTITPNMELSEPLRTTDGRPLVQFAGEASHPHYYSTVHGAIETGHREADRIINLHKK